MNGIDPPSGPIFDYNRPIKELNERIPCRKCGKSHGNGVTDSKEYTHTFIDICPKCWSEEVFFTYKPITEQVVIYE